MSELTIVAAWAYGDGELVEVINKECPLCGEYLHIEEFVEDWCRFCDERGENNEAESAR